MFHMTMEGTRAPELVGDEQDWINSEPLMLRNMSGKIILIDIWDYTCVNCLRTLPYIKEWYERYKNWGLVVIGIHTPEFEFARSKKNVEAAVRRLGITYPVLLDNNRTNWDNYANRYWPRKFLIDSDRVIVHDHIGEGGYAETEAAIQKMIRARYPDADLPRIMEPVRVEDEPGAVCYPVTPETYAGYRHRALGNPEDYQPNVAHSYTDPAKHSDGLIYLRGAWLATPEALIHARITEEPEDYLALKYHALEVNVVIKPENDAEFDVFVTHDGKPLQLEDRGEDIRFTNEGMAYIHVDQPRMYKIVRNPRFGSHELRLSSTSNAFGIYAFTFGSCKEPD